MKNVLIYIAGVLTGIVLTIMIALIYAKSNNENTPLHKMQGITLFDKPGDSVDSKQFKVFQVIESGAALAFSINENPRHDSSSDGLQSILHALVHGPVVLLINDEGKLYYDDEIVKVADEQNPKQVGVYRYSTESGYKTVPVIQIIKK